MLQWLYLLPSPLRALNLPKICEGVRVICLCQVGGYAYISLDICVRFCSELQVAYKHHITEKAFEPARPISMEASMKHMWKETTEQLDQVRSVILRLDTWMQEQNAGCRTCGCKCKGIQDEQHARPVPAAACQTGVLLPEEGTREGNLGQSSEQSQQQEGTLECPT